MYVYIYTSPISPSTSRTISQCASLCCESCVSCVRVCVCVCVCVCACVRERERDFAMCVTVLRKLRELWSGSRRTILKRGRHKCQKRPDTDLLSSKRDLHKRQERPEIDLPRRKRELHKCQKRPRKDLRSKRNLLALCCESFVSCVKSEHQRHSLYRCTSHIIIESSRVTLSCTSVPVTSSVYRSQHQRHSLYQCTSPIISVTFCTSVPVI
jgi:hypothetical protein